MLNLGTSPFASMHDPHHSKTLKRCHSISLHCTGVIVRQSVSEFSWLTSRCYFFTSPRKIDPGRMYRKTVASERNFDILFFIHVSTLMGRKRAASTSQDWRQPLHRAPRYILIILSFQKNSITTRANDPVRRAQGWLGTLIKTRHTTNINA